LYIKMNFIEEINEFGEEREIKKKLMDIERKVEKAYNKVEKSKKEGKISSVERGMRLRVIGIGKCIAKARIVADEMNGVRSQDMARLYLDEIYENVDYKTGYLAVKARKIYDIEFPDTEKWFN